jgi:hypothetical protein
VAGYKNEGKHTRKEKTRAFKPSTSFDTSLTSLFIGRIGVAFKL